jgi:hypothetical protein
MAQSILRLTEVPVFSASGTANMPLSCPGAGFMIDFIVKFGETQTFSDEMAAPFCMVSSLYDMNHMHDPNERVYWIRGLWCGWNNTDQPQNYKSANFECAEGAVMKRGLFVLSAAVMLSLLIISVGA